MSNLKELEEKAFDLQQSGHFEEAINIWEELLNQLEGCEKVYPYLYLADCYFATGKHIKANEALQISVQISFECECMNLHTASYIEAKGRYESYREQRKNKFKQTNDRVGTLNPTDLVDATKICFNNIDTSQKDFNPNLSEYFWLMGDDGKIYTLSRLIGYSREHNIEFMELERDDDVADRLPKENVWYDIDREKTRLLVDFKFQPVDEFKQYYEFYEVHYYSKNYEIIIRREPDGFMLPSLCFEVKPIVSSVE